MSISGLAWHGLAELSADASTIMLPDAELQFFPTAFTTAEADHYLDYCLHTLPWRQDDILIAGRRIPIPRLQNWFGDAGMHYCYSGIHLTPLPWTKDLLQIRARIHQLCAQQFNALLANQYRHGADSVSWHSDDEPELGKQPVIASVSFGETRIFEMRHRGNRSLKTLRLPLHHGSLLVMRGDTQSGWQHQIPKEKGVTMPRINLTFRHIFSAPELD